MKKQEEKETDVSEFTVNMPNQIGGRFSRLPEHMQSEDDIPSFLRTRRTNGSIAEKSTEGFVERVFGSEVLPTAPKTGIRFVELTFTQACPACGQQHKRVQGTYDELNDVTSYRCPLTGDSVINAPSGLTLNPITLDEDVEKSPQRSLQEAFPVARETMKALDVYSAVGVKMNPTDSKMTYGMITDARSRLSEVENRKKTLRAEIEKRQNELAGLTTESDFLRQVTSVFDEIAEVPRKEEPFMRVEVKGADDKPKPKQKQKQARNVTIEAKDVKEVPNETDSKGSDEEG
jgi:hypothetical protein